MKRQHWQRLRRIAVGDDNPLRRYVDKLESAFVVSLVVAFLVAAPLLGIFAVRDVGAAGARQLRTEATWVQRPATLTEGAASGVIGVDGEFDTSWVMATWTARDGVSQSGPVAVQLNARAGQHVMLWMTRTGQLTPPKLTAAGIRDREVMAALAVCAGLAVVLSITAGVVRVLVNRRRIAGWTKAWEAIGPRWSSLR
jgi:hypothetical protein